MRSLAERGLSVPGDLRLASFGNYTESSLPMVSLTSLDFDYNVLGHKTARLVADLIEGREVPHETTDIPMELHVRASSQPA